MTDQKNSKPKTIAVDKTLTSIYHIYRNKYEHLIRYKKDNAKENRDTVLNVVRMLKAASTKEIENYMIEITKQDNQKVKGNAYKMYENGDISDKQKEEYIKENSKESPNLRTIQRSVKHLTEKEGLLENKFSRYYLSDKGKSDVLYFPQHFGKLLLDDVCNFPLGSDKENIREFVDRFGAMIIYTFIQGISSNKYSSGITPDGKLSLSWIEEAIPIRTMFEYFLTTIIFRSEKKKYHEYGSGDHSDQKIIERIRHLFQGLYPEIYKVLENSKSSFMTENKLPSSE
jgi:hypothetical protein